MTDLSRRRFVQLGAAGAGILSLPACGRVGDRDDAAVELSTPTSDGDDDWASVRKQFLFEPGTAYLNNSSIGMPPRQVVEAVHAGYAAISRLPVHGRRDLQEEIAIHVIPGLERTLGASTGEVVLTRNATEALHLQAVGVRLQAGDEVVITTQEHPAGRRPWEFRAQRDDVRLTEVFIPSPLPPADEVVSRITDALTDRTRALAFCHVTRGGHRYPVERLCALARERDILSLVDGAQAVGQFPIDLHAVGCDAYAASLHKWMLGPAGTGFLYVRADARERIVSAFAPDATPTAPQLGPPGTAAFPVLAGLGAAVDFVDTLGLDRVERRCRFLSDTLKSALETVPGVRVLSGEATQNAPGSTIFEKDGLDAIEAVDTMERRIDAHIDEHQRDGLNAIRVSTHVYNTTGEIDRLVEALRQTP